jgi:hypothetical protein
VRALEAAAVELAARGYFVFPLRPRAKVPATRRGFYDATRHERAILRQWDTTPTANVGVACGASGVVVLDIDTKAGADPREILARFDRAGAPVVGTGTAPDPCERYPRSLAGRRGCQVYFAGTMPSAARLTLAGCELKGRGGYVVAPPSVHPSGVEYVGQLPPVGELPGVPQWLAELVPARPAQPIRTRLSGDPSRIIEGLARTVRTAETGNRNRSLYWSVCRAAEHAHVGQVNEDEALSHLRAAALEAGLDQDEIEATIRSGRSTRARVAA